MNLSHPIVSKSIGLATSWVLRGWGATMDVRFAADDPRVAPDLADRPSLYIFWHEMLFLPAYTHVQAATVLVSRHRDGELIAQLLRMLRGHAIRGSTDRGGVAALRQMMRHSRYRHLALAVDGPRGPRRVIPPGAIYLASRTGMPIIPVGMAYSACWRANSWDRTAVPKPFSRARLVLAGPIEVPPDAGRDAIESRRLHVQAVMDQVQSRAESLAANGAAARLITLHQLRQLKPRYPTAGP